MVILKCDRWLFRQEGEELQIYCYNYYQPMTLSMTKKHWGWKNFCKLIYTVVDLIQWKNLDFQNLYESNLTEAGFEIIRIMIVFWGRDLVSSIVPLRNGLVKHILQVKIFDSISVLLKQVSTYACKKLPKLENDSGEKENEVCFPLYLHLQEKFGCYTIYHPSQKWWVFSLMSQVKYASLFILAAT